MSYVYVLAKIDIAMAAGGPMGSPEVLLWTHIHASMESAQTHAEEDHRAPIEWRGNSLRASSGDLGSHMYTIEKTKVRA